MSNYGIKVSKSGFDVRSCQPKDLIMSSQFNTYKFKYTGSITISLPLETINASTSGYSYSYAHGLGYVPFFTPSINRVLNRAAVDSSTSFVVDNDALIPIPPGAYSPALVFEEATVYADANNITLEVSRTNSLPYDQVFAAKNTILYFSVYYNRVDKEFDLL